MQTQNHMTQPIPSKNKLVSRVLRPNFNNLGDIGLRMIEAAQKAEERKLTVEEAHRQQIFS